ncbi:MAG: Xaa-Pro peptidase family protein [Thermodesulfobacteriota bacterium]
MWDIFKKRTSVFQQHMIKNNIDVAVIYDPDNLYYFSAFMGYLGMQFGRPTLLMIPGNGEPSMVTPGLEAEMAQKMTWINDIMEWSDGLKREWRDSLDMILKNPHIERIGIEKDKIHPILLGYIKTAYPNAELIDLTGILSKMQMIKSAEDIEIMRQAGQVSIAMCKGGKAAIAEGVPEYEVALAVITAGTRKAAEYLTDAGQDRLFSPMIHNLQVLQSGGPDLSMVHRRPTLRRVKRGESVYMCFCEMNNFKGFKLGFDRQYWIKEVPDRDAELYKIALKAQSAALEMIQPGVIAEDVHMAAARVYEKAGFGLCYRTGRSVGFSLIEQPELKSGDKTVLKAGMTFAVDGAVSIPETTAARVGDSIVVTKNGFEYLTPFPKELEVLQ